MKLTSLAAIAAVLFSSSCYIRVPYGRQEFPKLGYALVFEQKSEEKGRTDAYQLSCIEKYKRTSETDYRTNLQNHQGIEERIEELENMVPTQEYTLQSRFIFTDSTGRACALDRVQKPGSLNTSLTGYILEFTFAVPQGETYTLLCGNADKPAEGENSSEEKKYLGSYAFFDSGENGCVFSGFPEMKIPGQNKTIPSE